MNTPEYQKDILLLQRVRSLVGLKRPVILMILELGLTQTEIADIFGVSKKQICDIVRDAIDELSD